MNLSSAHSLQVLKWWCATLLLVHTMVYACTQQCIRCPWSSRALDSHSPQVTSDAFDSERFFASSNNWMAKFRSKQGSLKTDLTWNELSVSHFVPFLRGSLALVSFPWLPLLLLAQRHYTPDCLGTIMFLIFCLLTVVYFFHFLFYHVAPLSKHITFRVNPFQVQHNYMSLGVFNETREWRK